MDNFYMNPYWVDVPKEKKILLPYPNLFTNLGDSMLST